MRAPFWITALLATLLALGIPVPGLAQDGETTEQQDDGEVVPGVPSTTFEEAAPPPPMVAPDLSRAWRRYRIGNVVFGVGAAGSTAGAGIAWLGYRIFDELAANGDNLGEVLVGIILGVLFMGVGGMIFAAGVPLLCAGTGISRGALKGVGLQVPGGALTAAWITWIAGVVGVIVSVAAGSTAVLAMGAGAVVLSAGLAVAQLFVNNGVRRDQLPRPTALLLPAPVSRSPGLAIAGRFW